MAHVFGQNRQRLVDERLGMSIRDIDSVSRQAPTFLKQAFWPLFFAAGIWSVAALAHWTVLLVTGIELTSRFDPRAWHIHELLIGFVMGGVAGFLLSAMPRRSGPRSGMRNSSRSCAVICATL